jgi:hypothetical protein
VVTSFSIFLRSASAIVSGSRNRRATDEDISWEGEVEKLGTKSGESAARESEELTNVYPGPATKGAEKATLACILSSELAALMIAQRAETDEMKETYGNATGRHR